MAEIQGESTKHPSRLDLQALIDLHGDRLVRSAWLLCGDETEAQDLAQETLLQAARSAHRFRGSSTVFTWVFGILRNLCYRHRRRQKRFVFEEQTVLEHAAEPDLANASDQAFCGARLAEALQQLSAEHREVVVLRYYHDMKIEQIAKVTGVSKGTVKSRLHYAIRGLQQILPREMNLFAAEDTHYQAGR